MNSHGPTRTDSRKQAVSIRLSKSDVRHIQQLAERLGARESDVIRFAIRMMLEKLTPLQDPKVRGRGLVPVFMESGADLMRYFELDATELSGIINNGVEEARRVEPEDIQLIAMSSTQRSFGIPEPRAAAGSEGTQQRTGRGAHNDGAEADTPEQSLRRYLYEKYLYNAAVSSNRSGNAT